MEAEGPRRLYRSRTNRMIAGVCGGIAEYLDIDPTLVRLVFVALVFLGGFSIILSIAAAMLMPPASLTVAEPKPATPLPPVSQWIALFFGIVLVLIGLSWLGALAVGFTLPNIWNSLRLLFRVSWPPVTRASWSSYSCNSIFFQTKVDYLS